MNGPQDQDIEEEQHRLLDNAEFWYKIPYKYDMRSCSPAHGFTNSESLDHSSDWVSLIKFRPKKKG